MLIIFSIIAFILIISPSILGVGLGVSPARLTFNNVLKGGYAQDSLYLSTDTTKNLSMFFETEGDVGQWITIENNITNITVSKSTPRQVKIIIMPPEDTANGTYSGTLRIVTDKLVDPQTGIGSSVKAAFMIFIDVTITGEQILSCSGGGVSIGDAEINFPVLLSLLILNEGNVRTSPLVLLNVWDKYQNEIVTSTSLSTQSILPTESVRISKEVALDLSEEQYWAEISVPSCEFSTTLPFNIVEKGGIVDRGDFIRIESKPWSVTGEIVPITAVFRNTGGRTVTANFKGEIKDAKGDIVKIIDTDKLDVQPGELVRLQTFYRAKDTGQYFVTGKIYYNNKLSTERGYVLNINQGTGILSKGYSYIMYLSILIVIAILAMLIFIKRKKQKHKRKTIRVKRY